MHPFVVLCLTKYIKIIDDTTERINFEHFATQPDPQVDSTGGLTALRYTRRVSQ